MEGAAAAAVDPLSNLIMVEGQSQCHPKTVYQNICSVPLPKPLGRSRRRTLFLATLFPRRVLHLVFQSRKKKENFVFFFL